MTKGLSRRQFLKAAATGGATAAFAPLFGLNARPVTAKPRVPERVMQTVADANTFTPLPSTLPLGAPLADIAMGADGTLWGIDTNGVPYSYDQLSQTWEVYTHQIDAITLTSRWQGTNGPNNGKFTQPLVVMGDQITSPVDGSPIALAAAFANLPDSFTYGLDGIAEVNGQLYLFRHGRYVRVDTSTPTNTVVGNPVALTSLANWPTTGDWAMGTFQALGSCSDDPNYQYVHLFGYGQWMLVDLVDGAVAPVLANVPPGPAPLGEYVGGTILAQMQAGFTALLFSSLQYTVHVYEGGVQWRSTDTSGNDATASYASVAQAAGWTPVLAQAPSGSASGLWAVTTGNRPVFNAGGGWLAGSYDGAALGDCYAVSVGSDGTVFCVTSDPNVGMRWALRQLQQGSWSGILAETSNQIVQLEVGDSNHIWFRDAYNNILQFINGGITATGLSATHIAANADGTLWHAANTTNAYRFISEGKAPATTLPIGAGGTVTRVASSGFASAFALSQHPTALAANGAPATQVYSYDSTYVWKTSKSYSAQIYYRGLTQSVVAGGTSLFTISSTASITDEPLPFTYAIVALDAQSGAEVWPQPYAYQTYIAPEPYRLPVEIATNVMLTYDPALNLVYVSGGQFLDALDAATGTLVWQLDPRTMFTSQQGLLGPATLSGSTLAVSERTTFSLLLIDTATSQSNGAPSLLWKQSVTTTQPQSTGTLLRAGVPAFDSSNSAIYMASQVANPIVDINAFDLSTGNALWHTTQPGIPPKGLAFYDPALDCLLGQSNDPSNTSQPAAAVFVNVGTAISALRAGRSTPDQLRVFSLPQPPNPPEPLIISTGMSYADSTLYFGDTNGTLYMLSALTMRQPTTSTNPDQNPKPVTGQPALISNSNGRDGVVVAFVRGNANVWLYDPSTGNLESIATDLTTMYGITYDTVHGLLYTCGLNGDQDAFDNALLGQVFALRPDQAIQDERDFIIESQLMQDYHTNDEVTNTTGNARYQTHVTIVDDNNVPMSNTAVKLWAEEDGTMVSVDGNAPVTIGPNSPTLFATDSSGSFTVISGGFASDGTPSADSADTADMFAASLQVWAAFMDPAERIIITPDAEFHGRLAAVKASGTTDSSQADPTGIDLSSTQSYDTTPLFAASSDDQTAATSMASAITQVTSAIGVTTSGAAQVRRTLAGTRRAQSQGATPPKYHAYNDLPGMSYSPVSALVGQALNPTAPLGISFTSDGGFQTHTPGEAADLIDAMQGATLTGELGSVFSKLRDAWKTIKADALKVEQAVVSVAKEVYVGIKYLAKEGMQVIKAVAADIKDAMATIGSFFAQLGKDIKNAIEALSILLHFDEFIKTQKFIKSYYTTMIGRLGSDLDAGFSKLIGYLGNMSTTVKDDFTKLIGNLQGNGSTGVGSGSSSWGGYTAGTSPHSTMSVAPANGSAPKQSVAVQGMWAAHKSRQNAAATTIPATLSDSQGDIIAQLESLFSDPTLFSNMDGITSQFTTGLSLKSPQAFFDGVFADILVLIEAALLAGIDIVQGVVQKLQGVVQSIVGVFASGGSFTIPIITPLWTKLGLPQLEIIDLVTLIAAIPVTLIYRVISGHWLSHDANSLELSAVGVTPPQWLTNAEGIITAMITLFNGVINAIGDTFSALIDPSLASVFPTPPWVTIAGYANMALMAVGPIYNTVEQNGDPLYLMVIGLSVLSNLMSLFWGKVKGAAETGQFLSWLLSLFTLIIQWIGDGTESQPWETIVSDILANIPGCLSLLKYAEDTEVKLVPPIADLACAVAAAAIALAGTIKGWGGTTQERDYRLLIPVVVRA